MTIGYRPRNNNALDFDLAKRVGEYFQLNNAAMNTILAEIKTGVQQWDKIAGEIGIARAERALMKGAFRV